MLSRSAYLILLLAADRSAAASDVNDVILMCEAALASGTVTSQANGMPRDHGMSVTPSIRSLAV